MAALEFDHNFDTYMREFPVLLRRASRPRIEGDLARRSAGLLLAVFTVLALLTPGHAANLSHLVVHSHSPASAVAADEHAGQAPADQPRPAGSRMLAADGVHFDAAAIGSCGPAPSHAGTATSGGTQLSSPGAGTAGLCGPGPEMHVGLSGIADGADGTRSGADRLLRNCVCRR